MKQTELEKASTGAIGKLFRAEAEQTVEIQCVLPDFLPDILRVIRCEGQCFVCDRRIGPDHVNVEGNLRFEALCVSPDGELFCAAQTAAWHRTLDAVLPAGSVLFDEVHILSCRARPVGSKKIEFTATLSLSVYALGPRPEPVIRAISDPDVQTRLLTPEADRYCGAVSRQFSMSEDLELAADAPSAERLLSTRVRLANVQAKPDAGQITLSGEVKISLLYAADVESGEPRRMTYTLPVSQIFSLENADADCRCRVQLCLCSYSLTTVTGAEGTVRSFAFDCVIYAAACCFRHDRLLCVGDAYCCSCESLPVYAPVTLETSGEPLSASQTLEIPVETGDRALTRIIDAHASVIGFKAVPADGAPDQIRLEFTVYAEAVCADENGELVSFEQRVEDSVPFTVPAGTELLPSAEVTAASATIGSGVLNLRAEVSAMLEITRAETVRVLTDFSLDDEKTCPRPDTALVICYGTAGESIFDIAKLYRTTPQAVLRQNGLETDTLDRPTVLIIPTI